jgi:hypothetical protein
MVKGKGLLPSREWKNQSRQAPWYPGETLNVGIGQGYFLVTPLQLASATSLLSKWRRQYHSTSIFKKYSLIIKSKLTITTRIKTLLILTLIVFTLLTKQCGA